MKLIKNLFKGTLILVAASYIVGNLFIGYVAVSLSVPSLKQADIGIMDIITNNIDDNQKKVLEDEMKKHSKVLAQKTADFLLKPMTNLTN